MTPSTSSSRNLEVRRLPAALEHVASHCSPPLAEQVPHAYRSRSVTRAGINGTGVQPGGRTTSFLAFFITVLFPNFIPSGSLLPTCAVNYRATPRFPLLAPVHLGC